MKVSIIGIDCATEASKIGLARGEWTSQRVIIQAAEIAAPYCEIAENGPYVGSRLRQDIIGCGCAAWLARWNAGGVISPQGWTAYQCRKRQDVQKGRRTDLLKGKLDKTHWRWGQTKLPERLTPHWNF